MAVTVRTLTVRDKALARRIGRELLAEVGSERGSFSEVVMFSSGYGEVFVDSDGSGKVDAVYVHRHGQSTRVPMLAGRKAVGKKHKAWGKTAKRVANPRGTPKDADSLYRIRREPLNAGGYTAGKYGQYFGRGEPLFAVETPDGDVLHVRGADRQDAMRNFREQYKYHGGGKHRTARFFGEKRKVANPSPYAKAQRKAMRAAGIRPDPKPKFKIGTRVRVTDTSIVGTVSYIGSYDAYIGQYRYKVKDDDTRSGQKYWNENSLVKIPRRKAR